MPSLLDGKLHTLSDNDKQRIRAFVFLSTTCPIANSYIVELNRTAQALPKGIELLALCRNQTQQDLGVRNILQNTIQSSPFSLMPLDLRQVS